MMMISIDLTYGINYLRTSLGTLLAAVALLAALLLWSTVLCQLWLLRAAYKTR